ncbi:YciI family protein [Paraburkholderia sp. SIMBA_053]|uniref:YciI family protein n=1 Tax=Paraburkholderia sp. SIMBA_053 TaxID=3085794 RepID=UPI00397C7A9A
MLTVIYCVDDPATPDAREAHYAEHRSHLKEAPLKILVAGPYTEEGSDRKIGSMLLVESETLDEARKYAHNDPFFVNKVWKEVRIHAFIKNIDRR